MVGQERVLRQPQTTGVGRSATGESERAAWGSTQIDPLQP